MKTTCKIALITLFAAFALSACGNKGPLVLPDEEATETVADDAGNVDADVEDAVDDEIDDEAASDAADTTEDDAPPADTDPPGDGND